MCAGVSVLAWKNNSSCIPDFCTGIWGVLALYLHCMLAPVQYWFSHNTAYNKAVGSHSSRIWCLRNIHPIWGTSWNFLLTPFTLMSSLSSYLKQVWFWFRLPKVLSVPLKPIPGTSGCVECSIWAPDWLATLLVPQELCNFNSLVANTLY